MTSVGPGVLILLGAALAVVVVMALGAIGRVPMSMEPPRGRRRIRRARPEGGSAASRDASAQAGDERPDRSRVTHHAPEPEIMGESESLDRPASEEAPPAPSTPINQEAGRWPQ